MQKIIYPSTDEIIEYNAFAITLFNVKKSDNSDLLSMSKLKKAIQNCEKFKGDIYDKAATLLKEIVKVHAFASGNRRTAFITIKAFLLNNKARLRVKNDPNIARVMQGIREDYYELDEIKEWIKNGKIRKFKRK